MFYAYSDQSSFSTPINLEHFENYANAIAICQARRDWNLRIMQFFTQQGEAQKQMIQDFFSWLTLSDAESEWFAKKFHEICTLGARRYHGIIKKLTDSPVTQISLDAAYRELYTAVQSYKTEELDESQKAVFSAFLEEQQYLNAILKIIEPLASITMKSLLQNSRRGLDKDGNLSWHLKLDQFQTASTQSLRLAKQHVSLCMQLHSFRNRDRFVELLASFLDEQTTTFFQQLTILGVIQKKFSALCKQEVVSNIQQERQYIDNAEQLLTALGEQLIISSMRNEKFSAPNEQEVVSNIQQGHQYFETDEKQLFENYERLLAVIEFLTECEERLAIINECWQECQRYLELTGRLLPQPISQTVAVSPSIEQSSLVVQSFLQTQTVQPMVLDDQLDALPAEINAAIDVQTQDFIARRQQQLEAYKAEVERKREAVHALKAHARQNLERIMTRYQQIKSLSLAELKKCAYKRFETIANSHIQSLESVFEKAPNVSYNNIEVLIRALGGSIKPTGHGGSHRKIIFESLKSVSIEHPTVIGFIFQPHGRSHTDSMPRMVLEMLCDTLSRLGVTQQNWQDFKNLRPSQQQACKERFIKT